MHMQFEQHNLHGTGNEEHEVYYVPSLDPRDFWTSVTNIPCPVKGCDHTVVWYEAGYVPGYRVCMRPLGNDRYDRSCIRHRFVARGTAEEPKLIRDE